MGLIIILGPLVFYSGLIAAAFYGRRYRPSRRPEQKVSLLGYTLGVLAWGSLGLISGAVVGSAAFCAPIVEPGNLCGLGGWVGLGPLCAGLAMLVYARRWALRPHPPR